MNIDKIVSEIDQLFNGLNADIGTIVDIITRPQSSIPGLWNMVEGIFSCILPIGYSLLTLFFMLDFFNKTITFKVTKIENIIKILIRVILAKVIMESSFELLNFIYQAISDLISLVYNSPATIQTVIDIEALRTQLEGMGTLELIMYQVKLMPMNFVMSIVKIFIQVICYGRIIEIYIYTALAPLPLATMPNEEYSNTAKRFIQQYISVCLQGIVILIATMSFSGLVDTIVVAAGSENTEIGLWGMITVSIVLLYTLSQSKNWAKQIVGVS